MVLPVGAALMPIPSAPPINAAQSSAGAMRSSRAETVKSDDVSERSFSVSVEDDWEDDGPNIKINTPPTLMNAWDRVMVGGNPERKTLRDLTLILEALFSDVRRNGGNLFFLTSDHGQIVVGFGSGGRVETRILIPDNFPNNKKEKYARVNDEFTLSVLRALYKESTVNNFRGVRDDYLPVLLVR